MEDSEMSSIPTSLQNLPPLPSLPIETNALNSTTTSNSNPSSLIETPTSINQTAPIFVEPIVPRKRGRRSVTFANTTTTTTTSSITESQNQIEIESKPKVPSKFTEEEILAWRNNQIDIRQSELMAIVDRHDDYVRELFHLDRFVTLIGFDPVTAKEDKSDVFLNFQANYDLFMNTSTDLTGSSSGRRATRRTASQRKDAIAPHDSPPSLTTPSGSSSSNSKSKIDLKGKGKAVEENNGMMDSPLLKKGNGRGNGRKSLLGNSSSTSTLNTTISSPIASTSDIPHVRKKRGPNKRGSIASRARDALLLLDPSSASLTPSTSKTASTSKTVPKPIANLSPYVYTSQPISKRAKHFHYSNNNHSGPTILYSHASQLVDRAPFEGSLKKLLESYVDVTDEGDPIFSSLEARANYEADILTRVAIHRLTPGSTELFNPDKKPSIEFKRSKDHQDNLLDHVVYFSKLVHDERKAHILASKKVGKMVMGHFDKLKGKDEREKKEEERGRRALARWTVKEVRKKWKLAVNVVRARRKARVQVEQERIGKEQLNAMLDKSTSMLQAQQVEMAGSSEEEEEGSESSEEEESDSDEEREEDASDNEEEEEEEEESDEEEEEEDDTESTSALASPSISGSSTPLLTSISPIKNTNGKLRRSHLARSITSTSASTSPQPSSPTTALENEQELLEPESALEGDDTIFSVPIDSNRLNEDEVWEIEMEDEEDEDSESELGGLADESEMSIEELMKKSGYGAMMEAEARGEGLQEVDQDEEEEEEEEEEVEDQESSSPAVIAISSERIKKSSKSSSSKKVINTEAEELEAEAMSEFGSGSEEEQKRNDEDDKFEEMMDDDDDEEGSDDSEMDGLVEDAELSIEELRKKYAAMEAEAEESNAATSETGIAESEVEEVEEEGDEDEDKEEEEEDEEVEDEVVEEISAGDESRVEKVNLRPPFLLRGSLRPYQQAGLEWLASLYASGVNGILADEMGLGKTIQTISLLAHLACDKGQWGPHLVVVPTSVMLNWEMEFKKFLPGFKILTYYGTQKERKEKRKGWNTENAFHVCVTSYQLVLSDQHVFRRKPWHYMILDEAHHIKNFRSQRWQTLLGFNARHRLLLTGTPLQNNLMELWSLLYFLMPSGMLQEGKGPFADHADFQAWFSNPMERAIENGEAMDEETKATVAKLHTVLRPYLLRRLKAEVETQMPGKTESIVYCRLSKRQRFLYDDFMSRSQTRETLGSGHFLSIINCLMQLRKVCNHPDLFEVRPIVTSFAMSRSVASEYETKELLVRKRLLEEEPISKIDWSNLTLLKPNQELSLSSIASNSINRLNAAPLLPSLHVTPIDFDLLEEPLEDTQTIAGWKKYRDWSLHRDALERLKSMATINTRRCKNSAPFFGSELLHLLSTPSRENALLPFDAPRSTSVSFTDSNILPNLVKSINTRSEAADGLVSRFGFVTPKAKALDMPRHALSGLTLSQAQEIESIAPVSILQRASAKLSVAFPDRSLLQYDCGKLQKLDELLRECKAGGHRVLIFTQMTKVLDILEIFLSFHGHRYLRLDGSTKIEQRQIITERFNSNDKILCFISSTRSGGLGINLQGADTVIFYDSDWNPALDRQCQDRAHRIGQTREVRIWRFVTEHSIEENMLKKANQKRRLDEMVIAEGDFTTDYLAKLDWRDYLDDGQLKDLGVDETGDGTGAAGGGETAAEVRMALAAAEDEEDAAAAKAAEGELAVDSSDFAEGAVVAVPIVALEQEVEIEEIGEVDPLAGTVDGYMCRFVDENFELFD